jgi:hypothetical protein
MRYRSLAAAALALAAIAGYAAATAPLGAQGDVYPFQIGEVVTFGYPDNGRRDCRIEEIKGVYARCGSPVERSGPTYGRREPPDEWINVMQVERIIKQTRER